MEREAGISTVQCLPPDVASLSRERMLLERKLIRKLDSRLLPTIMLIYLMNFIDVCVHKFIIIYYIQTVTLIGSELTLLQQNSRACKTIYKSQVICYRVAQRKIISIFQTSDMTLSWHYCS